MKIILADVRPQMIDSWTRIYFGLDSKTPIIQGDIIDAAILHGATAVVSPANSFGFMDGGVDLRYRTYFGKSAEERLINKIRTQLDGELLIGQATFVMSGRKSITHIIAAPTMRVPQNVRYTVNAYLAFKATLRQAKLLNVECLACPGMCSNTGGMPSDVVAMQMFRAYEEVILGQVPKYDHVFQATHANDNMIQGVE